MASLNHKRMLFFTTSPRTPFKMGPEIALLGKHFSGQKWNRETQAAFMELLSEEGFYGGKSVIVPMDITTFRKMLTDSYKAEYQPSPMQVKSLFEYSLEVAQKVDSEVEWYEKVTEKALNWLSA